jgi:hypothetical protein
MDEGGDVFLDGKEVNGKNTPINSKLGLILEMDKSADVKLLKDLAPITLPPLDKIDIHNVSEATDEVKHFLVDCLGQTRALEVNSNDELLNGSEWMKTIEKTIPKVIEEVKLRNFKLTKRQVEAIVDDSHHLKTLEINRCELRKLIF